MMIIHEPAWFKLKRLHKLASDEEDYVRLPQLNNPLLAVVTLLCLITGASAIKPMICDGVPNIYDYSHYGGACLEALMSELETNWTRLDVTLYTPNDKLWSVPAHSCQHKRSGVYYYMDWLGNPFSTPWEEALVVSADQCRRMASYHHCLKSDGGNLLLTPDPFLPGHFSSNQIVAVEHKYFQSAKNASVENCYAVNVTVGTSTALEHIMASPTLGGTRGCRYGDRQCLTSTGVMIVWDKPHNGPSLDCGWIPLPEPHQEPRWKGEFGKLKGVLIWRSLDRQLTLTFMHSEREKECSSRDSELVLSDQGTAIRSDSYDRMVYHHWYPRRNRRESRKNEPVLSHQLAAQLTAGELHLFEALSNSTKAMANALCSYKNLGRALIGADPTGTARAIFQNEYLQARVAGNDLLEVWTCRSIPNVTFSKSDPDGACYKYLPIIIETSNATQRRYLHPHSMITSENSPKGPCDLYESQLVAFNSTYRVRVNQRTGEVSVMLSG